MTDVLTFDTTKAFTKQFKEVKKIATAGGIVELHDGKTVFVFSRKPGTGGFLGALKGQVASMAPVNELFSTNEKWEADV